MVLTVQILNVYILYFITMIVCLTLSLGHAYESKRDVFIFKVRLDLTNLNTKRLTSVKHIFGCFF